MKKIIISLIFFTISIVSYGQAVLIRPGASIGYCSVDDMKGIMNNAFLLEIGFRF